MHTLARTLARTHGSLVPEDRDLSAALVAIGFPDRVGQLQAVAE